jgi:hypothetical protein
VLPLKDLRGLTVGEKVTVLDGKRLEELEGLPGGHGRGHEGSCRLHLLVWHIGIVSQGLL